MSLAAKIASTDTPFAWKVFEELPNLLSGLVEAKAAPPPTPAEERIFLSVIYSAFWLKMPITAGVRFPHFRKLEMIDL
jgi:hypothetical protein